MWSPLQTSTSCGRTRHSQRVEDDDAEDVFGDVPSVSQPPAALDEAFFAALDADAAAWRASREPVDNDALFAALNADADLQEEEILRSLGRGAAKPYDVSRKSLAPRPSQAEQAERMRKIRERADAARSKNSVHSLASIE